MHNSRILLVPLVLITCAVPAFAESVTLFRVFLNDGTALVSYGEYARVGDRLVFSMPIGAVDRSDGRDPDLHVVNLPASTVNWAATTKYADSARFSHYMATRAESDYAALAGNVAATLNAIILARDPSTQLDMAVEARRRLAAWPRDHYGYREDDVREMLTLLDEAISGLTIAAGQTSFVLDLVATVPSAPTRRDDVPMMPDPTPAETLRQAIAVANMTDVPADRVSLLRGVVMALDDPGNALPKRLAAPTRKWALHTIREEGRLGEAYVALTTSLVKRASDAAARADVRGVERVLATAERSDARLGRRRPDQIHALFQQLRSQLDAARRLRLARDQWQERAGSYRAYKRVVAPVISGLLRAERSLDDIKRLAGSNATSLVALGERLATNMKTLGVVAVPDELKPAHALL